MPHLPAVLPGRASAGRDPRLIWRMPMRHKQSHLMLLAALALIALIALVGYWIGA